jgi:hypothetical protein
VGYKGSLVWSVSAVLWLSLWTPRYAGSNLAASDGFLRAKKSVIPLSSEGNKAVGPTCKILWYVKVPMVL